MNLHINRQWVKRGILKQGKFLFYIILIQFFLSPSLFALEVVDRYSGEILQSGAAKSKAKKEIEPLRKDLEERWVRLAQLYAEVSPRNGNIDDIYTAKNILKDFENYKELRNDPEFRYYVDEISKLELEEENIENLEVFYYQRYLEEKNRRVAQEETEMSRAEGIGSEAKITDHEEIENKEEGETQGTAGSDVTTVHCDLSNPGDNIKKMANEILSVTSRFLGPMIADINEDEKIDNEDIKLIEEEILKLKIAQEPIQKELIESHNDLNDKSVFWELFEVAEGMVVELADMVDYTFKTSDEKTYRKIREKEPELRKLERNSLPQYDLNGDFKLDHHDLIFAQNEKQLFERGKQDQLTRRTPEFHYSTESLMTRPTAVQDTSDQQNEDSPKNDITTQQKKDRQEPGELSMRIPTRRPPPPPLRRRR